jgi:hypothetical protein
MSSDTILYCLTRDRDLAAALEGRLTSTLAFFYNDAARLHQATVLRPPDLAVVDAAAVRREYGDAGLGPIVAFLRDEAPDARVAVRPTRGAEWLVAAEAGERIAMLPAEVEACVAAVAVLCGPA